MNDLPICNQCLSPLNQISEEYRTFNVYTEVDGRYEVSEGTQEELILKCKKCGAVIPDKVVAKIESKLPKF